MKHVINLVCAALCSFLFASCEFSSIFPQEFTGTRYAFLAGLNYQQDWFYLDDQLFYAAEDAEAVHIALQEIGFSKQHMTLLTSNGEPVTSEKLLDALSDLAANLTDDDVLVFFFAGHGAVDNDDFYLITEDELEEAGNIRGSDLLSSLAAVPCPVVVFLDTCHSGAIIPAYPYTTNVLALEHDLNVSHPVSASMHHAIAAYFQHSKDYLTYPDIWFITAAGSSEHSFEPELDDESWDSQGNRIENGLFTHYLKEGLSWSSGFLNADTNRDRVLLLSELYRHIEASYRANIFFGQPNPHTSGTPRDMILFSY